MIKPEHLIIGERYGLAHNPSRPCVHWNIEITNEYDRSDFIYRLEEQNRSNFHHNGWFIVVKNDAGDRWEILEVPDTKSRYSLFSED